MRLVRYHVHDVMTATARHVIGSRRPITAFVQRPALALEQHGFLLFFVFCLFVSFRLSFCFGVFRLFCVALGQARHHHHRDDRVLFVCLFVCLCSGSAVWSGAIRLDAGTANQKFTSMTADMTSAGIYEKLNVSISGI